MRTVGDCLGYGSVLLALGVSIFGTVIAFWGGRARNRQARRWAEGSAYVTAAATVLASGVFLCTRLPHDSATELVFPTGAHSASAMLASIGPGSTPGGTQIFCSGILGLYLSVFAFGSRRRCVEYVPYILGTLLALVTILSLIISVSPTAFAPLSASLADELGPHALSHAGALATVHTPMLYLGCVGLSVPFAIAVAALLRRHLSATWIEALRRWTLIPWGFLTVGIVLSAWWGYEATGQGQCWTWDPVENAFLVPWVTATGALHGIVVLQRRGWALAWSLWLVVAAFVLAFFATFIARSPGIHSVHGFLGSTAQPNFFALAVLPVLATVGMAAASRLGSSTLRQPVASVLSKEGVLMVSTVVLAVFAFTILVGTLLPIVLNTTIAEDPRPVEAAFFNGVAIPIGLLLVAMMGLGAALPWNRAKSAAMIARDLSSAAIASLAATAIFALVGLRQPQALAAIAVGAFSLWVMLREMVRPAWLRWRDRRAPSLATAALQTLAVQHRRLGACAVHVAVLVIVITIAASHSYQLGERATLAKGQAIDVGEYTFALDQIRGSEDPSRFRVTAEMGVMKYGLAVTPMRPELHYYPSRKQPAATPHMLTLGWDDIRVDLVSFSADGSRANLKILVLPTVSWLGWIIPLFIVGALLALWPNPKPRKWRGRRRSVPPLLIDAVGSASPISGSPHGNAARLGNLPSATAQSATRERHAAALQLPEGSSYATRRVPR